MEDHCIVSLFSKTILVFLLQKFLRSKLSFSFVLSPFLFSFFRPACFPLFCRSAFLALWFRLFSVCSQVLPQLRALWCPHSARFPLRAAKSNLCWLADKSLTSYKGKKCILSLCHFDLLLFCFVFCEPYSFGFLFESGELRGNLSTHFSNCAFGPELNASHFKYLSKEPFYRILMTTCKKSSKLLLPNSLLAFRISS